jgi:hypothetical protein
MRFPWVGIPGNSKFARGFSVGRQNYQLEALDLAFRVMGSWRALRGGRRESLCPVSGSAFESVDQVCTGAEFDG